MYSVVSERNVYNDNDFEINNYYQLADLRE